MDCCPNCGAEIEGTAIVYLEAVTLDEHQRVAGFLVAERLGDEAGGVSLNAPGCRVYCSDDCGWSVDLA